MTDAEYSPIRELLLYDPLAKFDKEIARIEVFSKFSELLPDFARAQDIGALLPFARERPWRYWYRDIVELALNCLEENKERTFDAIVARNLAIDRGIENLFRPSKTVDFEEPLSQGQTQGFVKLATEFFPEYLRWAEHIFGNLAELFWSVKKRRGVEGNFSIPKAIDVFEKKMLNRLLNGYSEKVRNSIAHGQFNFTGLEILFGDERPERYSTSDFLHLFDELCRTCNSMGIAIILFFIRNELPSRLQGSLPLSIVSRFAAGGVDRNGLQLFGIVESFTPLAGRQLHIALQISMLSRLQVFGICCQVAYQLLEAGAKYYDRFLFELDHGKEVNSLAILLPKKLLALLEGNHSPAQLPEVFTEMQLLWFDEGKWKTRLRAWQIILVASIKKAKLEFLSNMRGSGIWIGKGRYTIREVENLGSQGIARLRIRAILTNPLEASNDSIVKEILYELVKFGRRKLVKSRSKFLDSGLSWRRRPDYLFIELYKMDGTVRWLRRSGWNSGNLIALAEYVAHKRKPVLFDNPDEIYKNIRIRYSMDHDKARQVSIEFEKLKASILKSINGSPRH